ncbi:hypothetical protein PVK06_030478 [Gossypium arboreum]|uniref:Uncharacterized protein n=1 Tax=Gossypium arboreum TaxID=29729 RepID=A0ABR0NPA8_GOSAR|nr:hypothetical protein PVK06_030478 [Gossypium arboreum]
MQMKSKRINARIVMRTSGLKLVNGQDTGGRSGVGGTGIAMAPLIKNDGHISNTVHNMGPYRALRGRVNGLGYSPDASLMSYLELAGFGHRQIPCIAAVMGSLTDAILGIDLAPTIRISTSEQRLGAYEPVADIKAEPELEKDPKPEPELELRPQL